VSTEGNKGSDLFLKPERTQKTHKGIIVGFDPGLTVGIAILDLKGNLISLKSSKEIRKSEIISHIIGYGRTVLVATDVYPAPKTVRKLASSLNSKIWSPYRSMSVESKIDIVDSYLQSNNKDKTSFELPQNAHERDALAAAVKTYRDHINKFRQIKKRAEKAKLTESEVDTIKAMVINGTSISNAIERINDDIIKADSISTESDKNINTTHESELEMQSQEIEDQINETIITGSNEIKEADNNLNSNKMIISRLKHKLNLQQKYIDNLKHKNILLKENIIVYKAEISKLQSKVDKLHYSYTRKILQKKELASKLAIIKRLQEKYIDEKARRSELEQKFRSKNDIKALELSENAVPVKIIESFTKEGIRAACDRWKIKRDDVVLLKNSEGGGSQTASMVINLGVKTVITMDKISDPAENIFEENMIPLIPASSVEMTSMSEFYIVNSKALKREIKRWIEEVDNQKKKEDKKKLLKLVDEYRTQRKRSPDQ
jgi:predicted RNase H-like nuclease (RuvC/YqgF family)